METQINESFRVERENGYVYETHSGRGNMKKLTEEQYRIQRVRQLESDIQREQFLRKNQTSMISDREYLHLLLALEELAPDSTVFGESTVAQIIEETKNTLDIDTDEDEEDTTTDDEDEEDDTTDDTTDNEPIVEEIVADVLGTVKDAITDSVKVDPKDMSANQSMSGAEIQDILTRAEHVEPPKKKRSYRRKKT